MFKQFKKNPSKVISWFIATLLLLANSPIFVSAQIPDDPVPQDLLKNYLPIIRYTPLPARDLSISALEITQATQSLDNNVPLVAGRPAVARVYARINEATALSNVTVALHATRSGVTLPGSPMVSAPGSAYPVTVASTTLRANIAMSFNFTLPAEWLSDQVVITAEVDFPNIFLENSEANNFFAYTANFSVVPALDVYLVPIRYYSTYEDQVYDFTATQLTQHAAAIKQTLMAIYPVGAVNMQIRSTSLSYTGDLYFAEDWYVLLTSLETLKKNDKSPYSEVYYGLIPMVDDSGDSWWYGGIVGMGEVGQPRYDGPRASIGLASGLNYDGTITAAHEIGHNLSSLHAPCGGVDDPDPLYPYTNGLIGQFGLRVSDLQVMVPTSYYDIMTYCGPEWVSDYNYRAWMNSQLVYGAVLSDVSASQPSLVLSGRIDASGSLELRPSYVMDVIPDQVNIESDYLAQFLDAQGQVMASYPVSVHLAQSEGFSSYSIHTALPLPEQAPASIRILKDKTVLAEQDFIQQVAITGGSESAQQVTAAQSGEWLSLRWGMPDQPALVRYSEDQGKSWTILEINRLGGWLDLPISELPQQSIIIQVVPAWNLQGLTTEWQPAAD